MLKAAESGMSRRFRECGVYQSFEGLCRILIKVEKGKINELAEGDNLFEMITMFKSNAWYAQLRVQ